MRAHALYFSRLLLSDCTVGSGTSPDHATSSGVRALPPIGNWEGALRLPSPCPEDRICFSSRRRERGRLCDKGSGSDQLGVLFCATRLLGDHLGQNLAALAQLCQRQPAIAQEQPLAVNTI